ncbi:MAG: GvpL/GvpF family gas vesicle protein [Acidobacteriota bacterium]|nr:GvpL/GvpF family gas vesicle protein [Acidobacteriota bacterium]
MTVLYCLVHSETPVTAPPGQGLPGAGPARAVLLDGGLTAIVSTIEMTPDAVNAKLADVDWVSKAAIGHEALIESVMQPAATVLPMKLLTLFSGDARLVKDLASQRKTLVKAAARVAGCREYGLRVVAAGPAGAETEPAGRPSSGLAFLERKKQARDATRDRGARRAAFARDAFESLAGAARDAVQRPVAADEIERPLLDAAFLVAPENTAAFAEASERLSAEAEEAHCAFRLTGPWPAYHFVQVENAGS